MPRLFQTICVLFQIVALAILLDASFATQQVSAKPIPLSQRITAPPPWPSNGSLKSLRYVRSTPDVSEPHDGKHAIPEPNQPPLKSASEAQTLTGKRVVARVPNQASSKGQPSDPRGVQRLQSGSSNVSRRTGITPASYARNAPRTSSSEFKKKTETLKRQRRELKHSAKKFHRLAKQHHLHNDTRTRERASHFLHEFYNHARAANTAFSQLAAVNGTMDNTQSGELEVIIGDIVNTVTQVLSEAATLTGNIPILGPDLEGVVTQIQGVLTNIMDTAQSFLDNVLGTLSPIIDSVLPGIV